MILAACFGVAIIRGAPYLPTYKRDADDLLKKCQLNRGDHLIDLGSGDGKVLLAAARRGIRATGYEINPIMWLFSVFRTWPYRKLVSVRLGNLWRADLDGADVVFVFLLDRLMANMEEKLKTELKPGAICISYVFALPHRKPIWKTHNAYGYKF